VLAEVELVTTCSRCRLASPLFPRAGARARGSRRISKAKAREQELVAAFVASRATETTTGASPSENSSRIGVGSASIVNRRRSTEPGIQKTRSGAIPGLAATRLDLSRYSEHRRGASVEASRRVDRA